MSARSAWSPPPWEPPLAGTETEHILGALERLRATFRWKADGLTAEQLRVSIGASALTMGGLLKHLAYAEDYMFTTKLRGDSPGEPWDSIGGRPSDDWSFESAKDDPPEDLYGLYDGAVARSRQRLQEALDEGDLGQPVDMGIGDGRHANLRRMLCDFLEEYGRHTGHADLIREAIDGGGGAAPPARRTGRGSPAGGGGARPRPPIGVRAKREPART